MQFCDESHRLRGEDGVELVMQRAANDDSFYASERRLPASSRGSSTAGGRHREEAEERERGGRAEKVEGEEEVPSEVE